MAIVNSNSNRDMKECPLCHEMKPKARFFTPDEDAVCRRCQIGLLHDDMKARIQKAANDRPWQSTLQHGYVYLFYSSLMGLHKIGKSINPISRKQGLSIPNIEVVFVFYTQHMSVHETLLHHIYKPQCVGGEWFRITDAHVQEIKYIGSRLGTVIESPEDFDWKKTITKQREIEGAQRIEVRQIKEAEEAARRERYKAFRAQFRRRCPNCLRLFRFHPQHDHKFCSKNCRNTFKNSTRIQNAYLSDPDNIAIALIDTYLEVCKHDYDESESGTEKFRNATKQLSVLEQIEAELDELANQAYYLMGKD